MSDTVQPLVEREYQCGFSTDIADSAPHVGGDTPRTRAAEKIASADRLVERWPAMRWFLAAGALCIIGGGLVAAITRPTEFTAGPWVAAYTVLVGGVAQIALGAGQALLATRPPLPSIVGVEAASWNAGLVATLAGTLLESPTTTTIGGVTTCAALILFLVAVRRPDAVAQRPTYAYRAMATLVLLSVPVGLVLAWFRHG